jgi:two-component system cell cycle response regulator DivK
VSLFPGKEDEMHYKILVVDDDERNLDITARHLKLRSADYEVIKARDGAEGLEKAQTECPHLILMDLQMPNMDGYEATRRLRADQRTRAIPIIVISASVIDDQVDKARQAGCDEFVEKPIDWPELYEKIELLLTEETTP